MKHFYELLKWVYGPQSCGTDSVLNTDEAILLANKASIVRGAEHFENILNKQSHVCENTMKNYQKCPWIFQWINPWNSMKIQLLFIKHLFINPQDKTWYSLKSTNMVAYAYLEILNMIWHWKVGSQDLNDALIVHLYNREGNRCICDDYHNISHSQSPGRFCLEFSWITLSGMWILIMCQRISVVSGRVIEWSTWFLQQSRLEKNYKSIMCSWSSLVSQRHMTLSFSRVFGKSW